MIEKCGKFTFKWLGPYEVDHFTDHGLISLKNQKGNIFQKMSNQKMSNKLLLKYYIVSDTDHIYSGNVFLTEDEKVLEEDINLFKPIEFRKSYSPNDESNKLNNLWNKLADEIVKNILLNAIGSSSNAIQDYHSIMQTCSTFQIVKQKGKRLLPRVYIDTHEKWEHSSYRNMIMVNVRKLTKLFSQNSVLLLDISNIIKEKTWKSTWLFLCKKNIRVISYTK